jgi:hypothetical protein
MYLWIAYRPPDYGFGYLCNPNILFSGGLFLSILNIYFGQV